MTIVERIETEMGSHIEPQLDETWDELAQLEWHAAVVAVDTGLSIEAFEMRAGRYSLIVGGTSTGDADFHDTWTYLNGICAGAREAQRPGDGA